MRKKPVTMKAHILRPGAAPPVNWAQSAWYWIDVPGAVREARAAVPTLPTQPRLGMLREEWEGFPKYAFVVAPPGECTTGQTLALSAEAVHG